MIAIAVFAFLVGSVSANPDYNWEAPVKTHGIGTTPPPPESVCETDPTSCGCCLMQQKLHKMEEVFNMSLNAFSKYLQETRSVLDNIRASRSAFSVALTNRHWCLGPFLKNTTIVYMRVFLNLGNNYNSGNGIFIVPRSGVYVLSLTVYSDSGSQTNELQACATMMVDDMPVSTLKDMNLQDHEDSATAVVVLQLNAGAKVFVVLPASCFLCDDGSHYNTFTGFLLYATD